MATIRHDEYRHVQGNESWPRVSIHLSFQSKTRFLIIWDLLPVSNMKPEVHWNTLEMSLSSLRSHFWIRCATSDSYQFTFGGLMNVSNSDPSRAPFKLTSLRSNERRSSSSWTLFCSDSSSTSSPFVNKNSSNVRT